MDNKRFWRAFTVGAIVGVTQLLGPIHEMGHIMFGVGVSMTGWTETVHKHLTLSGVLGGYYFEAALYPALSGIFHVIYTKTKTVWLSNLSIFCWGYTNSRIIDACFSQDFLISMPKIGYRPSYAIIPYLIGTLIILALGWAQWRVILERD